jgi:dienelactone hydrolase
MIRSLMFVAASILGGSAAASTDAPAVATRDFFRQYDFRSATVSPHGDLVAAVVDPDGGADKLLLRQVDSDASDTAFTADKGDFIGRLQWISDDILLFFVMNDEGASELYSVQWQGIKDGKPQVHIGQKWGYKVVVEDPLLNSGGHALVSQHEDNNARSSVYNIDFTNFSDQFDVAHRIATIDAYAFMWLADGHGQVRMVGTYGAEGQRQYQLYRPSTGHWYPFRSAKPGELFYPVSFTGQGDEMVVETDQGRPDTQELWTYDPAHDKFVQRIYGNDEQGIGSIGYDWYRYKVTSISWQQGSLERHVYFDDSQSDAAKQVEKAFPDHLVEMLGSDREGKRRMVYVSGAHDPGSYHVYDLTTHKDVEVGKRMPWIPAEAMAQVKSNTVQSTDGFNIEYLVALPPTGKGPYPVVVMPHGGPLGIVDTQNYDPELQLLANRGFAVIQVNYRGSSGGGKKFYEAGKQQWGQKIEDDIELAVHAALAKYPLDADKVCIYGASYGGYSAMMSVIRDPALYKCAASLAGVMDVPLLYQTSDWAANRYMRQLMTDITGDPDKQSDQLDAISPVYNSQKITRPVFIAQGAKDDRVDQEHAYRMKAALEKQGKKVEFKIYQNAGHGFSYVNDDVDFYDSLVDFMDQSLGITTGSRSAR